MTIKQLFAEVKNRENNGSCSLSTIYADPELYTQFRKSYGTVLKKEDEEFLMKVSEDEEWAGFVPNVVNVLESFSENVLKAIIKSVVIRYSPVLEYAFIPCIRVFGILKVDEVLIDYLKNGTNSEKRGVLRAFYFARPTITGRSYKLKNSSTWIRESFGYKFHWDEEKECYIEIGNNGISIDKIQMTAEEFISYCPTVGKSFFERQKALLETFKGSENRYLQLLFSSNIERTQKQFHSNLKKEANEYFMLKKRRKIPENKEEFRKEFDIELKKHQKLYANRKRCV